MQWIRPYALADRTEITWGVEIGVEDRQIRAIQPHTGVPEAFLIACLRLESDELGERNQPHRLVQVDRFALEDLETLVHLIQNREFLAI
jgi:hypothetical protein